MGYDSIFWLPICAVLTGAGLVLSYYAGRRRGYRSMLRGAAWSLLPLAAYLTGSVKMFWRIGDAIGSYASGFVFSPVRWAGVGVAGLAAVLFVATSGRERRKAARQARQAARVEQKRPAAAPASPAGLPPASATSATSVLPAARQPEPAQAARPKRSGKKAAAPADDDMKDVEDILRNRGI